MNELAVGFYKIDSAEDLWERLRDLGITHVLTPRRGPEASGETSYFQRAYRLMADMLGRRGRLEFQENGYCVYSLESPGARSLVDPAR